MIRLALTLSVTPLVICKWFSNSLIVKLEVKNVGKLKSMRYCKILPNISSLAQSVNFSAPISSINKSGTFFIYSKRS